MLGLQFSLRKGHAKAWQGFLPRTPGAHGGRQERDRAGPFEDFVHRPTDLDQRVALIQMVPRQFDETGRAEKLAAIASLKEAPDDTPDEVANRVDGLFARHPPRAQR
jgi:hypothetical protein